MFRNLAVALFVLPKLVIWPTLWFWRCRRNKCNADSDNVSECSADSQADE